MRPLSETDPLAIASYRLLGVLGGGGMGRVYLGESRSGRRVAIKVVRSDLAADPSWRRRFAREVAAVRSVNPLFTASVVDADVDAPEPWLATTYIDGPSLALRVAESGPLAPQAVLVLASGLAEALAAIHGSGLVHRDLKPSNVIINDEGPHIIDFGIALTAETPATTSVLLGTPSYIAPERIHGSEADPASDIFSLGATLVFAATGRTLVTEGPVYAQLMQITTGRFDLSPVPPDLRPLIVRCVSHQAKDRPTAEELSRILGAARVPSPTPGWYAALDPVAAVPRVPGTTHLTRRRLLVAGGILTAAAATSGAAAVLLPPVPPTPHTSQLAAPAAPPPPLPKPKPGEVIWHAASGAVPLPNSPGTRSVGNRILVDAERIITANGPELFATKPSGGPLWKATLPAGLVTLRRWGTDILVNDARRFWLYDAAGNPVFLADVVAEEEAGYGADNADNLAVQIGETAVGPDLAFASLGTATIAIAKSGKTQWRTPRPPRRGTEIRPATGGPAAASATWLLTHNVAPDVVQTALRRTPDGATVWNQNYQAVVEEQNTSPVGPPPPPGGGAVGTNPPENDEDWSRPEACIVEPYAVLREARTVHVFNLSNGKLAWERTSTTPVAMLEVVGDLVLLGADRLTAYNLVGGAQRWQQDQRGARMAGTLDGTVVIAAGGGFVAAYNADGAALWKTSIPAEFSESLVDDVFVDAHTAFVTFKARGQRRDPLEADVLAIALDDQATRIEN